MNTTLPPATAAGTAALVLLTVVWMGTKNQSDIIFNLVVSAIVIGGVLLIQRQTRVEK